MATPEVSTITISGTTYNLKDATGRTLLAAKQDKLTAGDGITITNNVISANPQTITETVYKGVTEVDTLPEATEDLVGEVYKCSDVLYECIEEKDVKLYAYSDGTTTVYIKDSSLNYGEILYNSDGTAYSVSQATSSDSTNDTITVDGTKFSRASDSDVTLDKGYAWHKLAAVVSSFTEIACNADWHSDYGSSIAYYKGNLKYASKLTSSDSYYVPSDWFSTVSFDVDGTEDNGESFLAIKIVQGTSSGYGQNYAYALYVDGIGVITLSAGW